MMKLDEGKQSPPLKHAWRMCMGQGSAEEILRHDLLEHLAAAKKRLGFGYLRFHGLFHDRLSVVSRGHDGGLVFHWGQLDRVLDALLERGIRPFLELGPMPGALASGGQTIFRWEMNVTPPRVMDEWSDLVGRFTAHCAQRYGLDEVRNWYFEVWNEPNLQGFWTGTREQYWELYAAAARAVKSVDPRLKVGGPATAQAQWIPEFITYCVENGVPVDFVSTHSYLQDEQALSAGKPSEDGAPSLFLHDQFVKVRREVKESALPDLEIHWTEWNALSAAPDGTVSWTENPCVDAGYSATLALDHAVRADDECSSLSWWVVSDVFGEDGISPLAYSCAYGLYSVLGIPKPALHAFEWLGFMRGPRLAVDGAPLKPGLGSLACRDGDCLRVLLWNHAAYGCESEVWRDSLEMSFDRDMVEVRRHLTTGAGSAFESWNAAGAPPDLTVCQESALKALAEPKASLARIAAGTHRIDFEIGAHEILFFEWSPSSAPAMHRGIHKPGAFELETKLAAVSS